MFYEMIIANAALRASFAIGLVISNARSCNNCQIYVDQKNVYRVELNRSWFDLLLSNLMFYWEPAQAHKRIVLFFSSNAKTEKVNYIVST